MRSQNHSRTQLAFISSSDDSAAVAISTPLIQTERVGHNRQQQA
ncbi:hypothetical protein ACE1CD_31520 [Aerosakkonema sp. BLCC-F183]